jgi:hypothetical protein
MSCVGFPQRCPKTLVETGLTYGVRVWAGWGVCSPPRLSHLREGHLPKAGS